MSGQDDHSTVKRQQIIRGAETIFTECGYEGASMSRIALQAAVSKGTLYNYFTGKSELFAAFVSQKTSTTLTQVFGPLAEQDDIRTILHQIAHRMVTLMLSPGSLVLYRIVVSEAGKFPHLAQIFWEAGPQRALAHMSGWLDERMQSGQLRQGDPDMAADQFFSLCQTSICTKRRLQLVPETSVEEIELMVDGAIELFLARYGLERRDAAANPPSAREPMPLAASGTGR